MSYYRGLLAVSEPKWHCQEDQILFTAYRDKLRLTQFLMALRDDFERTRASILNRQPLPSLEIALLELISEETSRLSITSQQSPFIIAATSSAPPHRSDNSRRPRCTHYHRIGHTVKTCYDIVGRPPGKSTGLKNAATTTTAPSGSESSSQIHQLSTADLKALLNQVMSRTGSSAMSATSGNTWLTDSACCNHMTSDSQLFTSKPIVHHGPTIHTANGSSMHVTYTGTVKTQSFSIPDTYLVPQLSLNLLSIGELCDNGYDLFFSRHGCVIKDSQTGQRVGTGRKIGWMFELTSL
ncbi:hypothetical protein CFOL_v3_29341 [Cephalotus follicularis]|uniref:Retrovirus-related Pol polyprotein from transposon TNT 1-94-like beta-barrel domain-containing protein n=1 Tax=Cephalotus follicularis TaxID=3775 RepID=A0A1Q3D0A2_CEPFO|nr:hypothetical protein CFOL_v3_29341 [Cephalotus follicularis]